MRQEELQDLLNSMSLQEKIDQIWSNRKKMRQELHL